MTTPGPTVIEATDGRLLGDAGPLAVGSEVSLRIDDAGLSLLGGNPPTAWQIPFTALAEPRAVEHRGTVELGGWVAGSLLQVSFPASKLMGASSEGLDELLAQRCGRRASMPRRRAPRRRWWLLIVGLVALGAAASLIVWLVGATHAEDRRRNLSADRAQARSMNLTTKDLPAGWVVDQPELSPLSGFLGTRGGGAKPSAADRKVSAAAVAGYQSCMGISDAKDRVFGAAGVRPPVEIPGSAFGRMEGVGIIEVGTVTQRYATADDVTADRRQISSPKFATCFAEALGRMASASGDVAAARADLPVTVQALGQPLGTFITGANVEIPIHGSSTGAMAEIGITVLISGRDEQTLFTIASPGSFPPELRQQIVGSLAARLAGTTGSAAA